MKKALLVSLLALSACGSSGQSGADASVAAGPDAGTSAKGLFQKAYALSSADISCTVDEDCCVVVDGCNSAALIVSKADEATAHGDIEQATKLAQGPTSDAPCNACITPQVIARCASGKCVGRELHCTLDCLGDAGVPDANTSGWCTGGEVYGLGFSSQDHCGNEIPLPAGVTDDPACNKGGGAGGGYSFGCSPY